MKLSFVTMVAATMVNAYGVDFYDVVEAHEFVTKKADTIFNSYSFSSAKGKL